jgi:hypothetical protein
MLWPTIKCSIMYEYQHGHSWRAMSSLLTAALACILLMVMSFNAALSCSSSSSAYSSKLRISTPMMRSRCCSSSLLSWYSYLSWSVWSNSEMRR